MSKYIRIGDQVFEKYDETATGFKARPLTGDLTVPLDQIETLDPSAHVKPILTPKQRAERRREKRKYGNAPN